MVTPMTPILNSQEAEIAGLLVRYACPTSFAHVRAFIMGSIACPNEQISPQLIIQALWRGKMPKFRTLNHANEFYDLLINEFWNSLVLHQDSKNPFQLLKVSCQPNLRHLNALAQLRLEEVSGFFDGICGPDDELILPRRANQALDMLNEMTPHLAGLAKLSMDKSQKPKAAELQITISRIDELTEIAEKEINAAIMACHLNRKITQSKVPSGNSRLQ